jgi:hypothetical protein
MMKNHTSKPLENYEKTILHCWECSKDPNQKKNKNCGKFKTNAGILIGATRRKGSSTII